MKKLQILFVVNSLFCISFFAKGQDKRIVYSDSSTSKMEVTKTDDTEMGRGYSTLEFSIVSTTYSVELLTVNGESGFFAVKKTSKLDGGQPADGNGVFHHIISVDFTPLTNSKLKPFSIKCDCHDIVLHREFYETVTYGCCDEANRRTYYSYGNQKEICEGDGGIISYYIYGTNITCYIGFATESHSIVDTGGTLYIGYNSGKLYKIRTVSPFFPPKINIVTGNPNDHIDNSFYSTSQISSLGRIDSVNQINNLKISLVFTIYKPHYVVDEKVVDIPIINGKPFGKDEKEQTINISDIK